MRPQFLNDKQYIEYLENIVIDLRKKINDNGKKK